MSGPAVLHERRIVLGVSGSIAAYKSVDLASKLTQMGALVDTVMTDAAQQFVTPLAFQSVTGRPVYTSMWHADMSGGLPTHVAHVALGESADALIIAPATANTIAKLAAGLADDLLSVTALASRAPLLIAPAMDGGMYMHDAVQANMRVLAERGAWIVEPETGRFASGLVGKGRLPETPTLIGHIRRLLGRTGPLVGRNVVVTAGGTREPIDPVRYVSNRSSGKQGYALAQAALDAGASVTLVSTVDLPAPSGAVLVSVSSAQQMLEAVLDHASTADVLIMAAAVADYRPKVVEAEKIKKVDGTSGLSLDMEQTQDILVEVHRRRESSKAPKVVVGFAAESQDLLANAKSKLARKGLDLIVANDITASDAGFSVDTNRVTLLSADGEVRPLALMSKSEVADEVVAWAAHRLSSVD
ncbi:MAG: bifunctional phosphopantothenoylcysteine decarboxylase/phosphopantothenate--cysteine ligase CoaBC [Chloroflexi bacterium]|nr:bifunctional phosphopantothenoylcysteine decarboxylase/phosphopantothenate--cysteine ligase CoaBC [Chloroflexota bacterium]